MKNSFILNIFLSIGGGFLLTELQLLLNTSIFTDFLKNNLVMLLVALIAINSATLSIVLTKIRELMDKHVNANFSATKSQMILSINEQIILIFFSIMLIIVGEASSIKSNEHLKILVDVLICASFIYGIRILYDTAKSVFVILDYK